MMSKLYGSYSDVEAYRDVRRPVMADPEGRKGPNIQYRPGYVMTTERFVEHVTRAPLISFVRPADHQGRPYMEPGPNISRTGAADHPYWSNYGADYDEPNMDSYGYPQPNYGHPMENFITKVQTEVSKPQPIVTRKLPGGPFTSNWRAAQQSNHSHSPARYEYDSDDDRHHQIPSKKIQSVPIGNKYNFYERPNEGPVLPARPLTRPTNDIHEAVEILTGGIRTLNSSDKMHHQEKQNQPRFHSPQKMHHGENKSQPRFGVPPKEVISYSSGSDSDASDGGEAGKGYAKLKPKKAYNGAINSDDLIKKYNGAKVPW